eukprot:265611_1
MRFSPYMITLSVLTYYISCINGKCDYSYEYLEPIDIIKGQNMGRIRIKEMMEISFDLKFNTPCINQHNSGYCYILRIGDYINTKLPWIRIWPGGGGFMEITYADWDQRLTIGDSNFMSTIYDGNFHNFYFEWSYTKRVFIFDDIVYENTTGDGIFDWIQQYLTEGSLHTLFISEPADFYSPEMYLSTNGTMKNLCINTTPTITINTITPTNNNITYNPTNSPTKHPIKFNTSWNSMSRIFRGPFRLDTNTSFLEIRETGNTIEIEFYLKTNNKCPSFSGGCNILKFALRCHDYLDCWDNINTRIYQPQISILPLNKGLKITYSTFGGYGIYNGYEINTETLILALNDGEYHNYYFKFSPTERIFILDYNLTLYNKTGDYDISYWYKRTTGDTTIVIGQNTTCIEVGDTCIVIGFNFDAQLLNLNYDTYWQNNNKILLPYSSSSSLINIAGTWQFKQWAFEELKFPVWMTYGVQRREEMDNIDCTFMWVPTLAYYKNKLFIIAQAKYFSELWEFEWSHEGVLVYYTDINKGFGNMDTFLLNDNSLQWSYIVNSELYYSFGDINMIGQQWVQINNKLYVITNEQYCDTPVFIPNYKYHRFCGFDPYHRVCYCDPYRGIVRSVDGGNTTYIEPFRVQITSINLEIFDDNNGVIIHQNISVIPSAYRVCLAANNSHLFIISDTIFIYDINTAESMLDMNYNGGIMLNDSLLYETKHRLINDGGILAGMGCTLNNDATYLYIFGGDTSTHFSYPGSNHESNQYHKIFKYDILNDVLYDITIAVSDWLEPKPWTRAIIAPNDYIYLYGSITNIYQKYSCLPYRPSIIANDSNIEKPKQYQIFDTNTDSFLSNIYTTQKFNYSMANAVVITDNIILRIAQNEYFTSNIMEHVLSFNDDSQWEILSDDFAFRGMAIEYLVMSDVYLDFRPVQTVIYPTITTIPFDMDTFILEQYIVPQTYKFLFYSHSL